MADVPRVASGEDKPPRRGYLDWLRGLAVLIMIETHIVDSWTAVPDRATPLFARALILGGFGAPLFLLLAGVSVSLSAAARARRLGDPHAASRAVARRGLEIFLLAFLFRVQAWILGWAPPWTLLRVDILNIMGPSIIAAALMWGAATTVRGRVGILAAATLGASFLTPIVRNAPALAFLPDPIEAYLRPVGALASFSILPWAGFVFGGALVGLFLERTRTPGSEQRTNIAMGAAGTALAAASYAASYGPSPFARSSFWTSSPSFFFLRLGLLVACISLAYLWGRRGGGRHGWSPLRQLGRTSLFIYWIHVEMVYGLVSMRLHRALTLPGAIVSVGAFTLFMLLCSIAKERIAAQWQLRQQPAAAR